MKTRLAQFEERLTALRSIEDAEERNRAAHTLVEEVRPGGFPIVEGTRVTFVYYGPASQIGLAGDWTWWQVATPFERLEGTDLFFGSLSFSATARLQYKLVVDGDWVLDPGNPHTSAEGFGVNSEFVMGEYVDRSRLTPVPKLRGRIEQLTVESAVIDEDREVFLYTPHPERRAGAEGPCPILLFHDGGEALTIGRYQTVLDNLIEERALPPTCALFIPPHNRHTEYAFNPSFIRFTVEEALTQAVEHWRGLGVETSDEPHDRCVVGASLGGLVATETGLQHPEIVGAVLAQSPAYWITRGAIFRPNTLRTARQLLMVLQTGTICDALELTRIMHARLLALNAPVEYQEYDQGHTWGNWRTNLADGLLAWRKMREGRRGRLVAAGRGGGRLTGL